MPKWSMRSVTTPLEININGADGLQYMQSYSSANGTSVDHVHVRARHRPDDRPDQRPARRRSDALAVAAGGTEAKASAFRRARATSRSPSPCSRPVPSVSRRRRQQLRRPQRHRESQAHSRASAKSKSWATVPTACASGSIRTSSRPTTFRSTRSSTSSSRTTPTSRQAPSASRRRPGSQPFQIPIKINGRLQTPEEFKQIVVQAQPNGGYLRLGDVARVELGAQNYITSARYNGETSVVLADRRRTDGKLAADLQERARDDGADR